MLPVRIFIFACRIYINPETGRREYSENG